MLVEAELLRDLVSDIFEAAGCSTAEAARVARRLVRANLTGHDSHGVSRTARYVAHLRDGVQVANQDAEVVSRTSAYAVVDGHFGMGQTVGEQAVQVGIDIARENGVSIVALRHAGHLGRAGDGAEMAADAGLVSIHFMNVRGTPLVAPFGGVEKRFGTNPIAVGVPRPGKGHLIHDFATSVVAEGKANIATEGGPPLPDGSLISGDGELTSDPTALYGLERPVRGVMGDGALRAMGEHKGSGLAFMCELLGGALTGSGTVGPEKRRFCNGMLSIYVDPTRFDTDDTFMAEVADFVGWTQESAPAGGHDGVLVPGQIEGLRADARTARGIELAEGTWKSIVSAATAVGLQESRIAATLDQ